MFQDPQVTSQHIRGSLGHEAAEPSEGREAIHHGGDAHADTAQGCTGEADGRENDEDPLSRELLPSQSGAKQRKLLNGGNLWSVLSLEQCLNSAIETT